MGSDLLPKMTGIVSDDQVKDKPKDFLHKNVGSYPSLKDFFAHKTIGITGGTGFLGQGIIEKLLRCCPDVKKIILLIRNKRDKIPQERLEALTQLPAFDVLRESQPDFAAKLSYVCCNLESEDLGLSEDSVEVIKNEVNVFVHCAATLKFNEHMRVSFEVNVQCIRRLLKLARGMANLEAFIHISTAYSHCDRYEIKEQLYDCGIDYLDLEGSLRWMDDDLVTKVTPQLLKKRPNTYTLTKAMAEDAIAREGNHLPVCIVRPSMIIPAYKEPIPGWCTNSYGPTAFFVAYGKGVLRSVIADERVVADLIPVDLVVNGVLGAAMKTARDFSAKSSSAIPEERNGFINCAVNPEGDSLSPVTCKRHHVPIYHLTTGGRNPIYIRELVQYGKEWYELYPLNPLRLPTVTVTSNRFLHRMKLISGQTFPAFLYDVYLTLTNQRPVMLRLNGKLLAGMEVMEFFFTNDWRFEIKNALTLQKSLTQTDKKTFTTDAKSFEWKENIKRYVMGTRRFLVKESMKEYPLARKMLKRWKIFNFCVNFSFIAAVLGYTGLMKLIWAFLSSFRRSFVNR